MTSIISDTLRAAHDKAAHLTSALQKPIKPGEALPDVPLKEDRPDSIVNTGEFKGKIIILGVPAAFSPVCTSQVPGYIENYEKFKERGVDVIFVASVNDAHIVRAWKEKLAPNGTHVRFLADDRGLWASKLGLTYDATETLGSHRSKRFVIVAKDGVVEQVSVEEEPNAVTTTAAAVILALL